MILPAIVLVVGLFIATWSARVERERRAELLDTFTTICLDAAADRDITPRLTTAPPLQARDLARLVHEACGDVEASELAVDIIGSDEPVPGEGFEAHRRDDATHVVVIRKRAEIRLVLRLRDDTGIATIVGYSVGSISPGG